MHKCLRKTYTSTLVSWKRRHLHPFWYHVKASGQGRTSVKTLWEGSSWLLHPSSTRVVTTTAQIWPGRVTCIRHQHGEEQGMTTPKRPVGLPDPPGFWQWLAGAPPASPCSHTWHMHSEVGPVKVAGTSPPIVVALSHPGEAVSLLSLLRFEKPCHSMKGK